jgi:hypothetical protein
VLVDAGEESTGELWECAKGWSFYAKLLFFYVVCVSFHYPDPGPLNRRGGVSNFETKDGHGWYPRIKDQLIHAIMYGGTNILSLSSLCLADSLFVTMRACPLFVTKKKKKERFLLRKKIQSAQKQIGTSPRLLQTSAGSRLFKTHVRSYVRKWIHTKMRLY